MNSLAVSSSTAGEGAVVGSAAALDYLDPTIYRDQLHCAKCGEPKLFLEIFKFENGWLICCQGCGEESVVRKLPFSGMTSEAA
jgi:hypothetical protein